VSKRLSLLNEFLNQIPQIYSILNPFPQPQDQGDLRAFLYFTQAAACIIDLPLIARIIVVFPPRITPLRTRITIIGIAIALMTARGVVNILFAQNLIRSISTQLWSKSAFVGQVPFCMAHLALKLIDNL
jgi:hypothetical protein